MVARYEQEQSLVRKVGSEQRMDLNFDSDLSLTTARKRKVSNCKKSLGEGSGKHYINVTPAITS